MLEYRLDDLHWWDFEKLCQALLKAELSVGVEAWGGSGDWGNDAYCQAPLHYPGSALEQGPFQFQVKFVGGAHEAGAKLEARLVQAVRRECKRIKKRAHPPPRIYSLLTNAVPSPEVRRRIEDMIRAALPDCSMVVVHSGEDICSWLHSNPNVVRMFPQLLSHRDLSELLRRSGEARSQDALQAPPEPKPTPGLKRRLKKARAATRRHEADTALRLWEEVYQQARKEENRAEEVGARLNTALLLIEEEGRLDEAIEIVDSCLRLAATQQIGSKRSLLLQVIGEAHRIKGNRDLARGFLTAALEHAQSVASHLDEGFALLALSALEHEGKGGERVARSLELIESAYRAFSAEYLTGDTERRDSAKDGFAQCHCWKAEVLGHARLDEALAEWSRALALYEELGEGWAWNVGDTLLRRAQLVGRAGEPKLAFVDLDRAATIFEEHKHRVGLAKCYLEAGELLDRLGQREQAAEPFKLACLVASESRLDQRSSYFFFRYATKLLELRQYQGAEEILAALLDAPWLRREARLDVASQLCLAAKAAGDEEGSRSRLGHFLSLLQESLDTAVSAKERRQLLIRRGQCLADLERFEEALQSFRDAIGHLEAAGNKSGVVECWFHIRGIMQRLNDKEGEREASLKVLDLGGEENNPMLAALTLVGLAQLDIHDQQYSEASLLLERAKKLAPDNPVVDLVAADLNQKLPQFLPPDPARAEQSDQPPRRTLSDLLRELREWCITFPDKRKSILAVWYHIHRSELWNNFRSMLGAKFLICTPSASEFGRIRAAMLSHGDILAWATALPLRVTKLTKARGIDQVPVPDNFMFPAGVAVVTPQGSEHDRDPSAPVSSAKALLRPSKALPDRAYYVAFMRDPNNEVRPFFVGRKQIWMNSEVVKFMLEEPLEGRGHRMNICLPLTEGQEVPKLGRILQVSSEARAIPLFAGTLPQAYGVSSDCDAMVNLPRDTIPGRAARQLWMKLVLSCSEAPQEALGEFIKGMENLTSHGTDDQLQVRVYVLRFGEGPRQRVQPAVVLQGQTRAYAEDSAT